MTPSRATRAAGALVAFLLPASALPQAVPARRTLDDVVALMARAKSQGQVGTARKSKFVDAREAHQGEIVVTAIKGEGTASQSRPARRGDWVVRNRCPETGNEVYLVAGITFNERYRMTGAPISAHGWREYRPLGLPVQFHILPNNAAPFEFTTAGGDLMRARPGDAIIQNPKDEKDVYRIAAASFACTYDVVKQPGVEQRPAAQ